MARKNRKINPNPDYSGRIKGELVFDRNVSDNGVCIRFLSDKGVYPLQLSLHVWDKEIKQRIEDKSLLFFAFSNTRKELVRLYREASPKCQKKPLKKIRLKKKVVSIRRKHS